MTNSDEDASLVAAASDVRRSAALVVARFGDKLEALGAAISRTALTLGLEV